MTPGAFPIMTPGVSPQQAAGLYSATGIDLATEMTEFVMASPEALEFVKEGYPQHPLFGKYPTTKTLGTLQKQLEKGPKSVSGLAKTVSGVTSVGLAGLPVYLSAFTVYQITNNTGSAAIGAFLGTVGAFAGVVCDGPAALSIFFVLAFLFVFVVVVLVVLLLVSVVLLVLLVVLERPHYILPSAVLWVVFFTALLASFLLMSLLCFNRPAAWRSFSIGIPLCSPDF